MSQRFLPAHNSTGRDGFQDRGKRVACVYTKNGNCLALTSDWASSFSLMTVPGMRGWARIARVKNRAINVP